jgi:NAD dependent epimerase/dehydratase family enzyme
LNRPSFFAVPKTVLKIALGEMADLVLTGQRVVPRHALSSGFTFRFETLDAFFAQAKLR